VKWIRRIFIAVVIFVCGLACIVFLTALNSERPVGFQVVQATDIDGQPFVVGVWYPTQARPWPMMLGPVLMNVAHDAPISGHDLPLVVVSHGNGGGPGNHADLALALASTGYVVAAPMHTGDNYADQSAAGSVSLFSGRTRQLHATVDYMLKNWQGHDSINPERIGAFGFSAGGTTVLAVVGAIPDLRMIAQHCTESPEFICDVLGHAKSPLLSTATLQLGDAFLPDLRIKAAVVAAPGLGFTMVPDGLAGVHVPIQLWSGDKDDKVPYASNSKLIRELLGSKVEFHAIPGAGHFSFLVPCGVLRPPGICSDPAQFDRNAFHIDMNASVLAFFEKNIRNP
jgi:predicted dienelactone hydrolase